MSAVGTIERELYIDAPPALVYSHFVDPEKLVRWMGREATIDPRPHGDFCITYNGFDRMQGQFVELIPHTRIVFTWGWATLGTQSPPLSTTVQVTFTPDGGGTRLRLVHSGFERSDEVEDHSTGWDLFLQFLVETCRTGLPAQPLAAHENESQRLAVRLNALLCDLRYLIEGANGEGWARTCPRSGWPVGVTAYHAVDHARLAQMAAMVASGERPPVADFTLEMRDATNAESAKSNANVTREQVLAALLNDGPAAVEQLKGIDPAGLSMSQPMTFAADAGVSVSMLVEGPLLEDLAAHLEDIRTALRTQTRSPWDRDGHPAGNAVG